MITVSDGPAPARLADAVFVHLRDAILSGEKPPGARIHDTEVADELGVSATPVREALHHLEHLGLVETEASRFTRVSVPSPGFFDEAMEYLACQIRIAVRLGLPKMGEHDRTHVASLLDRVIEACERDEPSAAEIYETSLPPVTAVSDLTGNQMFEQSFHTAWFALQRSLRGARTLLNSPAFIAERFRELRTAVLTGDIDLAENAAWRLLRDESEGGL